MNSRRPQTLSTRAAAWLPALALLLLLLPGCATNPATGKSQLSLIGEAQEIEMGRQTDKEISENMGLYDDPELQDYVQRLGSELAAKSERPDLPWSFRVLDDPVVNAFALPGGFIYVTRGIMSHLNSEAELATVVGHEIGHVTARHSVNQMSKAQLANIGLAVGMIVEPRLQQFSDVAQMGLSLMFLKFSRDDERQADELGLRYMTRGAYDPREAPDVFDALKRVGEASSEGGRLPGWMSTHPHPENRTALMRSRLASLDLDFDAMEVGGPAYIRRLDGLVFGENPREGFFRDGVFHHPDLGFRMAFPDGWKTANQRYAVMAMSPEEDALIQLTLAGEDPPRAAARSFFGQEGVHAGPTRTGRVNGLAAAWGNFEADSSDAGRLAGSALFLRHGDLTYQLLGFTPQNRWRTYARPFETTFKSFDRETDPEVLDVQPARLHAVKIERAMSLEDFDRRYPSSVDLETLARINAVTLTDTLPAGSMVKQVVGGPDA